MIIFLKENRILPKITHVGTRYLIIFLLFMINSYNTIITAPIITFVLNENIEKIYKAIKGKYFEEKIGIYQEKTSNGVSSANKQTHRIITYVQKPIT